MMHPFDGHAPQIHEEAFVHPDSTLIGNVVIGARSTIWPCVVLRGDMQGEIVIGDDTSVQDGTICHLTQDWSKTVVGNKVTVGHGVILHGCVVEDECLIGMGAIILDNARIGRGSFVAAGTLVPPNKEIPPGSFVIGSPAVVKREVNDKDRAMIDDGWKTYVEYGAKYKRELAMPD
jgi:carbonic anhydrase/acetyltransferase-like protein (isoleucine patch superfamily)